MAGLLNSLPLLSSLRAPKLHGWVHPDYRGRLIAVMGTNWVLDLRREQGLDAIVVTVRKNDGPAQKYHRRFGFEQIGEVVHWRIGPWRFNRVKMARPS